MIFIWASVWASSALRSWAASASRLADLLLAYQQVLLGVLLLHPPVVGVVVRGDNAAQEELRHGDAVVLQAHIDPLPQGGGQVHQVGVNLQNVDAALLDGLGQ